MSVHVIENCMSICLLAMLSDLIFRKLLKSELIHCSYCYDVEKLMKNAATTFLNVQMRCCQTLQIFCLYTDNVRLG